MKTFGTLALFCALCASGAAHAADDAAARAQYETEKTRCMSGATGQDQASCLRSAGAAYDAAKAGRLTDPNTTYQQNALTRCRNLPAADQADCVTRVGGGGVSSGSVQGGGIVKETVTPVPAPTTVRNGMAPIAPITPVNPAPPAVPAAK